MILSSSSDTKSLPTLPDGTLNRFHFQCTTVVYGLSSSCVIVAASVESQVNLGVLDGSDREILGQGEEVAEFVGRSELELDVDLKGELVLLVPAFLQ